MHGYRKVGEIISFTFFFSFLVLGKGRDEGGSHHQPPKHLCTLGWGTAT